MLILIVCFTFVLPYPCSLNQFWFNDVLLMYKVRKFLLCAGGSSHAEVELVSSIPAESISVKRKANTKSTSVERKAKKFSHEEHVQAIYSVPEVSALQKSKRKVKQSSIGDVTVDVDAKTSVKTDKISGTVEYMYTVFIALSF